MTGHNAIFDLGFAALLAADSLSLLLRFAWLAQLSLADGLNLFRKHPAIPTNSESTTFLWFGNFLFGHWSKQDQIVACPPCYDFPPMNLSAILQVIDSEISKLQQARAALSGVSSNSTSAPARTGRHGPRHMSQEARNRIAAAQRARWAKVRAQKEKK